MFYIFMVNKEQNDSARSPHELTYPKGGPPVVRDAIGIEWLSQDPKLDTGLGPSAFFKFHSG